VPVMILARLAVDKEHQRKSLAKALLKDALLRTAQAADIAEGTFKSRLSRALTALRKEIAVKA